MLHSRLRNIELPHWRLTLATVGLSACFLGFLGYNDTVLNIPATDIRDFLAQSYEAQFSQPSNATIELLWTLTTGAYGVGLMLGGPMVVLIADRFGRKWSLLIGGSILMIISNLMIGLSSPTNAFEMLLLGRFLSGFQGVASLGLLMLWLMEASPIKHAGFIGTLSGGFEDIGMLVAQVLALPPVLGNHWPVLLSLGAFGGIIALVAGFSLPESPKYLHVVRRDTAKAVDAVRYYHGSDTDVGAILTEYDTEAADANNINRLPWRSLWAVSYYRNPLILTVVSNCLASTIGWYVLDVYSSTILVHYGMSVERASAFTVAIMATNVVTALITPLIMELVNRRTLLFTTGTVGVLAGIVIFIFAMIYDYGPLSDPDQHEQARAVAHIMGIMFMFVALSYNMGVGSVPLVLPMELSPQEIRPLAMATAVTVMHVGVFASQTLFDFMFRMMNAWVFLIFPVLSIPLIGYLIIALPETRNRELQQIIQRWKSNDNKDGADGLNVVDAYYGDSLDYYADSSYQGGSSTAADPYSVRMVTRSVSRSSKRSSNERAPLLTNMHMDEGYNSLRLTQQQTESNGGPNHIKNGKTAGYVKFDNDDYDVNYRNMDDLNNHRHNSESTNIASNDGW